MIWNDMCQALSTVKSKRAPDSVEWLCWIEVKLANRMKKDQWATWRPTCWICSYKYYASERGFYFAWHQGSSKQSRLLNLNISPAWSDTTVIPRILWKEFPGPHFEVLVRCAVWHCMTVWCHTPCLATYPHILTWQQRHEIEVLVEPVSLEIISQFLKTEVTGSTSFS